MKNKKNKKNRNAGRVRNSCFFVETSTFKSNRCFFYEKRMKYNMQTINVSCKQKGNLRVKIYLIKIFYL